MTNKLLLWIVDGDCILISNCLVGFYCAFRVSSSRRRILDCLNNYRNMNSSNNIGKKNKKTICKKKNENFNIKNIFTRLKKGFNLLSMFW